MDTRSEEATAAIWDPTGHRSAQARSKGIRARRVRMLSTGIVTSLVATGTMLAGQPFLALLPGFVSFACLALVLLASDAVLERLFSFARAANAGVGSIFGYLLLTPIYFGLVWPLGLVRKWMGADALQRRAPRAATYWKAHAPPGDTTRIF